jgi:AAA domain-containing protein
MQTLLEPAVPRHAEAAVNAALEDTRVVLVNGARQSGKSTLVRLVAKGRDAEWRDLDTALTRQAALEDPDGFVDQPGPMVIDEVQRAPDLLLSIKARVDSDPCRGAVNEEVVVLDCRADKARGGNPLHRCGTWQQHGWIVVPEPRTLLLGRTAFHQTGTALLVTTHQVSAIAEQAASV